MFLFVYMAPDLLKSAFCRFLAKNPINACLFLPENAQAIFDNQERSFL